jgi:hypothetical protein
MSAFALDEDPDAAIGEQVFVEFDLAFLDGFRGWRG